MKRRIKRLAECPHCHAQIVPTETGICPSCYKPMARMSAIHSTKTESTSSSVSLWTPRQIAVLSVFPGIPGGIVMSSFNWIKMGLARKAVVCMSVGVVAFCIYLAIFSFVSNYFGVLFALAFQLGAADYLYHRMKKDIDEFQDRQGKTQIAAWGSGVLIGLTTDAVLIALSVYFLLALGLIGIPK